MKGLTAGLLIIIGLVQGCSSLSEGRGTPAPPGGAYYERRCSYPTPLDPVDGDAEQVSSERLASLRSQFSVTAFETAAALGVIPFLERLLMLEGEVGPRGEGPPGQPHPASAPQGCVPHRDQGRGLASPP